MLLKQQFAAHKQGAAWDAALMTIERGRRTDDAHSLKPLYDLYEARIKGYQEIRRRQTGTERLRC